MKRERFCSFLLGVPILKERIHSFLQGVPVLKEFALICKEDPS